MRRRKAVLTGFATTLLAAIVLVAPAAPAVAATSRCPATFDVLHNDHIGTMSLPAGQYTVTVTKLSCASASRLFSQFLSDYDGVLPLPWQANAARRSFTRANGPTAFSVKRTKYPPAPPSPPTPARPVACRGTFSVLHDDSIGPLLFPKGAYKLRLLGPSITCQGVARLFARFLDDVQGNDLGDWSIAAPPGTATGGTFNDVRFDTAFSALRTGASTGGGGHTPSGGTTCPGSFSVLHDDHIGSLYLPKGPYVVSLLQGDTLTCRQASQQLTRFLDAARMPSPWIVDTATGTFTRGLDSSTGFRVKPAGARVVR